MARLMPPRSGGVQRPCPNVRWHLGSAILPRRWRRTGWTSGACRRVGGTVHNTKRMTPPPSFSQVFAELEAERTMSPLVARRVFDSILAGGWTPVQIGAFLVSLELL